MERRAEVILELAGSCIETAARRTYRALSAALLGERDANPQTERALELLAAFLQQTDFRALRTSHPELAGGRPGRVRIFEQGPGRVAWERLD